MMKSTLVFLCVLFIGISCEPDEETAIIMDDVLLVSGNVWKDTKNYGSDIDLDLQDKYEKDSKTTFDKLVELEEDDVLKEETVVALEALFKTYKADNDTNEEDYKDELETFLDKILKTKAMEFVRDYLKEQNKTESDNDFKEQLKTIWFEPFYSSETGEMSSGFQHVFMGEYQDGEAHGFHNWVRYYREEQDGNLKYKGWTEKMVANDEVSIVSLSFEWNNATKPVSTIVFGTKPEYDMAVYTLCWYMLRGDECYVYMGDMPTAVVTDATESNGTEHVRTAYFTVVENASDHLRPQVLLSMVLSFFLSWRHFAL